ncbi:MAG: phenylalanine--tRNA ligase beta subunit-related protein [Candidatus Aenigmatarchaeota archaeon]
MKFIIADEVLEKYPEYVCGIVVARNIDNRGLSGEILQMIKNEEARIKLDFNLETLAQHPFVQNWRKVYSSFGSRPAEFRASSEALIRRTLKGNSVSHISRLVDIYNFISLKYRTPVGGEDLEKISGNLRLRFADGSEKFIPLGSEKNENPDAGEVVYVDDEKNVLCRRWNWRESEITKLTENTKSAIIVIEALPPLAENDVMRALGDAAGLVKKFCGAETKIFVLSSKNMEIEI